MDMNGQDCVAFYVQSPILKRQLVVYELISLNMHIYCPPQCTGPNFFWSLQLAEGYLQSLIGAQTESKEYLIKQGRLD